MICRSTSSAQQNFKLLSTPFDHTSVFKDTFITVLRYVNVFGIPTFVRSITILTGNKVTLLDVIIICQLHLRYNIMQ